MTRSLTELLTLPTIEERFAYLAVNAAIGERTFGVERYINQRFYSSSEWRRIRNEVIVRDLGMDLGVDDFQIRGNVYIHHMNPLTISDIQDSTENLLDPEFLISCSLKTHNAIHYGDVSQLPRVYVERRPGDTRLW